MARYPWFDKPPPDLPPRDLWRKALILPNPEGRQEKVQAVSWIRRQLGGLEPAPSPLPIPGWTDSPPSQPEPKIAPRDRALEPIQAWTRRLADEVTGPAGQLAGIIGESFWDPVYTVRRMRDRAEANDWHIRLFHRELGLTPRDLVRECRLAMAAQLLRDTSLSAYKVARLVGYESERALRKLFQPLSGVPPSHARIYLRQVPPHQRPLFDQLFRWSFQAAFLRGELEARHFSAALAYFEGRFGPF